MAETGWLGAALALYAATAAGLRRPRLGGLALTAAVALHTVALGSRWAVHGHGPFTTMHEILSSSLWSLALVVCVAWWTVRALRPALVLLLPLWALLGAWLLLADNGPGHLPPTYATPLLYLHAVVGKLFLGLLLVAVALGTVPVLRQRPALATGFAAAPPDRALDALAHRFAAFAFVAQTLMLVIGAVWAQDAWGRYWAWDPLESWAFATWVALAWVLHARHTLRPAPARHGRWLAGVFVLAFLTFFGVPFLSTVPHQGAL